MLKLLILRSVLGGIATLTSFACLSYMQASDGIMIINTNPIWTNLLASCYLDEVFKKKGFFFCIISFVGIAFIIRPSFIFGGFVKSISSEYDHILGSICGLLCSFAASIATLVIR